MTYSETTSVHEAKEDIQGRSSKKRKIDGKILRCEMKATCDLAMLFYFANTYLLIVKFSYAGIYFQ